MRENFIHELVGSMLQGAAGNRPWSWSRPRSVITVCTGGTW